VAISWSGRGVAIASAAAVLLRPGTTRVPLKVTARGRRLIKRLGAVTVVAKGRLTRPDGSTLVASSTFTLRP
jgi:acyl-coenzyme A thioesterase PaaI-like protein